MIYLSKFLLRNIAMLKHHARFEVEQAVHNTTPKNKPFHLGLPVQVRDAELAIADNIPKQGVNRDFFLQNVER